jgi:hypothetical protein
MSKRLLLLAASILAIGLVGYLSRKSPAMEPPCPPGAPCEDPPPVWPMPVLAGILGITMAVALIVVPGNGRPALIPDRRSITLAAGLLLAAALLFALSLEIPVIFGYVAFGGVVAAFLLGGTGLRPRGSRLRGLMLGTVVYLIVGIVSALIFNDGYVRDMDLLAWVIQVPTWPGLWYLSLGGFLGG